MKIFSYALVSRKKLEALRGTLKVKLDEVSNANNFIRQIENGNLDGIGEIVPNESGENSLLNSILSMRDRLRKISLQEKERNWLAEGLAHFGEILRTDNHDLKKLCDRIISNLVKYIGANQGAIYLLNEENAANAYLELISCYAYERKKFETQQIEVGDGLLGQCVLEKETIFLTKVPREYIKITSGLGDAPPDSILIVPLKTEQKVYGVIELASFKIPDNLKREFVEKIAANIAATINNVRMNAQTKMLLEEQQRQTEELKAAEEEMRQNMEELYATQEEMSRKAAEIENRINAINESGIASIEFDLHGNITDANANFLKLMGYSLEELIGKHHRIFVTDDYAASQEYANFWKELGSGKAKFGEFERIGKGGRKVFIQGSYSILKDKNGNPYQILKLAADITSSKQALLKAEQKENLLNNVMNLISGAVFIIDKDYHLNNFHSQASVAELFDIPLKKNINIVEAFKKELKNQTDSIFEAASRGKKIDEQLHIDGQIYAININPSFSDSGVDYYVVRILKA